MSGNSSAPQQQLKNKPANTLFKQQRLAAWQPIMSPPHVTACFVVVAAIFIPIGAAIFSANNKVVDIEIRYDDVNHCTSQNNQGVFTYVTEGNVTTKLGCRTVVLFNVTSDMEPPIYLYYGLKNFYQNHRSFAKSRNEKQLAGNDITSDSDLYDTRPIRHPGENLLSQQFGSSKLLSVNGYNYTYGQMVYDPAGLVAWAKFNDSFTLYHINYTAAPAQYELICKSDAFRKYDSSPLPAPVPTANGSIGTNTVLYPYPNAPLPWAWPCHKFGISWASDREVKFKVPTNLGNDIWTAYRPEYWLNATAPSAPTTAWNNTYAPTSNDDYYQNGWYAGEAGHEVPVNTDEDLMVWMRTAALPTFRKLYRVIDIKLPAGPYAMEVVETYDVSSFSGEKYFALATVSWVGGKNGFLGQAYIAVGCVSFVAGLVFFLIHKVLGDRTQKAIEALNDLQ